MRRLRTARRSVGAFPLAVVLALVTGVPAQAEAKRGKRSDAIRAAKLIHSWRYDDARAAIAKLAKNAPKASTTRYLQAELAFADGDYAKTQKLLDGLDGGEVSRQVTHLRELVKSTTEAVKGFATYESAGGHFVIYYPPGKDQVIVELAAEVLERAYTELGKDFQIYPKNKIRVEILPRPSDLAKVSTLTEKDIETTGTIALCKYNKLMAVSPRATVFGYAWMDTLVHEYMHYIVSMKSHDTIPVWLHEGLAKFAQVRWRKQADGKLDDVESHLLATALAKDSLISFDDMHPSMAKLPSQEAAALAFAEVYTMVGYAHRTVGYEGLRKVIDLARSGRGARSAMAEAFGKSWREVEKGWKSDLKKSQLKRDSRLAGRAGSRRIRFDKGGKENKENVGIDQVKSERAQKFTRLGGMLRARGYSRAAALEYEKALAAAPGDPFIVGKLSRTYLELRKYDRAVELAEPLLESDDNDATPATTVGMAVLALGDPAKAAKAFEIALRVNPFDPSIRCGLADAYDKIGDDRAKRERNACKNLRN